LFVNFPNFSEKRSVFANLKTYFFTPAEAKVFLLKHFLKP